MKSILFSTLLLSSSAFATTTLNCDQTAGYETQGMIVKMNLTSSVEVLSASSVNLKNLDLKYTILDGPTEADYVWSEGTVKEDSVANSKGYNPRKYKNHMKFETYAGGQGYGNIDLIIPTEKITNAADGETFKAYAIMTYMDDHFGGTAQISCSLTKKAEPKTSFDSTLKVLNELVNNDSSIEGELNYKVKKFDAPAEMNSVLAYIMKEESYMGLQNLNMQELIIDKEEQKNSYTEILKAVNPQGSPFYCETLADDYYGNQELGKKQCIEKTKKIVKTLLKEESLDGLTLIKSEGNYYGDWVNAYLIGSNWKTGEVIIIEFDILHEI